MPVPSHMGKAAAAGHILQPVIALEPIAGMECGWERIHRRLAQIGRLDALKSPVRVRNFATDDEVSK